MRLLALAILSFFAFSTAAHAESLVEPDYVSEMDADYWIEYYSPANYKADQDFITGMRPHHAGAIPMSEKYLTSEGKRSSRLQALAGGIIRNQTFEIGMLDKVESLIQDIDFERDGTGWHAVALQGLANKQQFMRAPTPIIQQAFSSDNTASATDVQFAKAMIVHHEGALMMCESYLDNPATNNGYMERMCLDVLRDQAQEIRLMWNVIKTYPDNHCAIKITPDMIEGMDNMMDHMDFSRVNCEGKMKMTCCDNMRGKDCPCCGNHNERMEQCPMDFSGKSNHTTGHHKGHGH